MKKQLNESLPAAIPEFPVEIAGHHLTLRFDVNINKTKRGVKLQFILPNVPSDPRQAQQMANEIGTELQQKFAEAGLQIIYDVENPYKNVVGFLIPLPSLATFIVKHVLKGEPGVDEPQEDGEEKEQPAEPLPAAEQPPAAEEEPLKELMMRRAGIK